MRLLEARTCWQVTYNFAVPMGGPKGEMTVGKQVA